MGEKLSTLFKKDSKGKIREWVIKCGNDARGYWYETTHGLQGGAMQTHRTYVEAGKNLGRSNATTPEEQCVAEAEALWGVQRTRKGYTETIPDKVPVKPMLAKKFHEESHKVEYPCIIQPKLDGCLSGDSLIKTKRHGYRTIKDIVENKLDVEVSSLNAKNKRLEYNKVINYFHNREVDESIQWYELEIETGEKLQLTGNHKVYLPDLACWRRVDELTGNENLMLI